ncbi:hypothetical protein JCM11491_005076 [Sporobolomyces phaffii]
MLATHAPTYTPEQLEYLAWYNRNVQFFLYAAIFGFLVILATVNGLYRLLYARIVRRQNLKKDQETRPRLFGFAVLAAYRRWSYRRSFVLNLFGIRSASQALVIFSFGMITFFLVISGAYGHWDYMAHHAARICFALIPVLVGLASRELGVVAWITGLHSSTLVALHRWIGRAAIVLAGVHVAGRLYTNSPTINLRIGYQASGLVGFILWISMALLSIRIVRVRFYKFFIFSHLLAFGSSLIALSIHRPQVAPFIIAGAVIYSSDRLVRLASVAYYGFLSSRRVGAEATVEVLSEDVLRIKVETKKKWTPVASSFLPVTHLSSDPVPIERTQSFIVRVHKGFTLKLKERARLEQEKRSDDATIGGEDSPIRLSPIFTEGPYGHDLRLHSFESVLLVVGGSGVTFAVGFLLDLVRRARRDQIEGTSRLVTKRVTFVWSVRDRSEVEWIGQELREAILCAPPGFLNLEIYVTRLPPTVTAPDPSSPALACTDSNVGCAVETSSTKGIELVKSSVLSVPSTRRSLESHRSSISTAVSDAPFEYLPTSPTDSTLAATVSTNAMSSPSCSTLVNVVSLCSPSSESAVAAAGIPLLAGRCRAREVVERTIAATAYAGSIAVATCGPARLTEEVAKTCSDSIDPAAVYRGESRLNIMLHVESYGW